MLRKLNRKTEPQVITNFHCLTGIEFDLMVDFAEIYIAGNFQFVDTGVVAPNLAKYSNGEWQPVMETYAIETMTAFQSILYFCTSEYKRAGTHLAIQAYDAAGGNVTFSNLPRYTNNDNGIASVWADDSFVAVGGYFTLRLVDKTVISSGKYL